MTETTTAAPALEHERPCFCDRCLTITFYDLLDERAKLLDAAFADRSYEPGYERELAEELIAGIPAAARGDVLRHMLEWEHLAPRVMAVDCLLDECDPSSYEALSAMATTLYAAILAQDAAPRALRILVTNEICQRREWHG